MAGDQWEDQAGRDSRWVTPPTTLPLAAGTTHPHRPARPIGCRPISRLIKFAHYRQHPRPGRPGLDVHPGPAAAAASPQRWQAPAGKGASSLPPPLAAPPLRAVHYRLPRASPGQHRSGPARLSRGLSLRRVRRAAAAAGWGGPRLPLRRPSVSAVVVDRRLRGFAAAPLVVASGMAVAVAGLLL